jgi:hypothetical protein
MPKQIANRPQEKELSELKKTENPTQLLAKPFNRSQKMASFGVGALII